MGINIGYLTANRTSSGDECYTPFYAVEPLLEFLPKDNTYAYFRYNESEAVFVFINNSAEDRKIPWGDYAEITSKLPSAGTNVMTGETITIGPDTKVPPTSAMLVEYSLK